MRDRAIFRLEAVKYLNEFKNMIEKYRNILELGKPSKLDELKNIIKDKENNLESEGNKYKSENEIKKYKKELRLLKSMIGIDSVVFDKLELPANFEYIYQSSIKIKTNAYDPSIIDCYVIDYIRIKNMLQFAYINDSIEDKADKENKDNKDNIVKYDEKLHMNDTSKLSEYVLRDREKTVNLLKSGKSSIIENRDPIEAKIRLICLLFEFSFYIVEEYFPLYVYGFPSITLIIWLMNAIIGDELTIEEINPYIFMNNDVYNFKLELENDYLKKILKDNNIDYDKIIDNDVQYNNDYEMLDKITNLNPSCSIVINPYFKINHINKSQNLKNRINNSIDNLKNLYISNDIALTNEYLTIVRYAGDYVHRRFNLKMTNVDIQKELNIPLDQYGRVSKEIRELCDATGLIDPLADEEVKI